MSFTDSVLSSKYDAEPAAATVASPVELGAHFAGDGVDFALRAPNASRVLLCLIDKEPDGSFSERRYALNRHIEYWSGHVAGVQPGQRYGYRIDGAWAPEAGMVFNPAKLLLDPYARAIAQGPKLGPELYGHKVTEHLHPSRHPLARSELDSLETAAHGVVLAEDTSTADHPYIPRRDTIVFETHVKGFTKLHPEVPEDQRGTYKGMAHPAIIKYLRDLGLTTIELLPIHARMDEPFLSGKGLANYWGYNTMAFFAPEPSYATKRARAKGPQAVVDEVKAMVKAYHEAGLEIILDVVYNHTCEGGIEGPCVSFRGIDQSSYYMTDQHDPSRYLDTTGCGNSLDFRRQTVIRMTLDSLRYWVTKIGVDGFRFDLAATLGRNGEQFDPHHPFFLALVTDPVLRSVKLINEPWDIGPRGWQTGNFPGPTCDWNDHFRNSVRDFWISGPRSFSEGRSAHDMRDFATRLAGSADLFGRGRTPGGRGPISSINFVTAHDGFTLHDLVSYDHKHNEANGEDNRDGTSFNRSWNHGFEGIHRSEEPVPAKISIARRRTMRNLLGTLILSAGTPMILAGDEIGRSQNGNNNSYCQDNEISWTNWQLEDWQRAQHDTVRYLLRQRRENPVLRPQFFYTHEAKPTDPVPQLVWYDAFGYPMPDWCWFDPNYPILQMLRSGGGDGGRDALIVFNRSLESQAVTLPQGRDESYELVWDSQWEHPLDIRENYAPGARTRLGATSMRLYLTNPV